MGARPETGTEVEGGGRDFAGASRSAETGEAAGGIPAQVEARGIRPFDSNTGSGAESAVSTANDVGVTARYRGKI